MGRMKEAWMKRVAKGYSLIGDKFVCGKCFTDYAIQAFIEETALKRQCDYCRVKSKKSVIAAPINEVLEFIVDGIRTEWGNPGDEGVGWDSSEGGWTSAPVYHAFELVDEVLEFGNWTEELYNDIGNALSEQEWCKVDPHSLRPHERLCYDWECFSKQVKHEVRYLFFRVRKKEYLNFEGRELPFKILYDLGGFTKELGLIKSLPVGSAIFRSRAHKKSDKFASVTQLGQPTPEEAKFSNRMSPAGISMFYGSQDRKTAISEILTKNNKTKSHATVAKFVTMRQFNMLDLTNLPDVPSLFDIHRKYQRTPIRFFNSFLEDFSRPIKKDGREHYEYVPTQVVTEYFRHIFRDEEGEPVKGIVYKSAVSTGKSYVLFLQQDNCTQDNASTDDKIWLSMKTSSIKTKRII